MRKITSAVLSSKRSTQYSPSRQRLLFALLTFSSLTSGAALAAGGSLPTGGHFVGGNGAITQSGNHLSVSQTTQTGIINWQSFSIGKGDAVTIANGKGATLNRVTGGDLSTIAGSLRSTGSVYVVNQAGIVVGPSGKVVTNGTFVASTRDVSNAAFMAGGAIDLSGGSSGTVVNQGTITSTNGDVVLVGKSVSNSGSINAAKGSASLVAGDTVELQAGGDDAVLVATGSGDVTNTGTVAAAQVALNAAGGNVYALAVNNGGVIRATGTATKDGHVYLTAGDDLAVNGSVSAANADGSGGAVVATGKAIDIRAGAKISANGKSSGGTVLIGGKGHVGAGSTAAFSTVSLRTAATVSVAAGARISANAGAKGDGGSVVVWSDTNTDYAGTISATGGTASGHGGLVEVSSADKLGFAGRVTTMAAHGAAGTLLLDPDDVQIYSSTDTNIASFTNPNTSYMLNTTIDAALATNNVTISTTGTGGSGDIHFGTNGGAFTNAAPIFWNSSHNLTLNAAQLIDTAGGNPDATTGGANPTNPSVLVNALGSGTITFNAGGAGLTANATVISLTGDIEGSGGTVSLISTSATYRIEIGNQTTVANTAVNGAGTIIMQADEVRLGTNTGPTAIVRTPGEVDIVPTTAGAVVVGDIDTNGQFANDDNTTLIRNEDVTNITANLLVIGSPSTTSLSFRTANPTGEVASGGWTQFDAMGVNNLKLLTGTTGSISQDANTQIIVDDPTFTFAPGVNAGSGGLAVQTGGAITLANVGNSVGSIAFNQTGAGGDISFASAASTNNTLVVGTVADVSGIGTVGARTVTLAIAGDAVTQTGGATNAIAPSSGSIALDLEGSTSSFTLDNPANAIKTAAATVGSLTLYDDIGLSTAAVGSSSGINATGNITVVDNGALTIGNGNAIATSGGNVRLEDQTFVNSDTTDAGNALVATGGTWRVYSQDPRLDTDNGAALTYSFVQYDAANSYADPFTTANAALNSHATGNGFIYTVAPTLKETVAGQFNKTYDGTTAVTGTLVAGDYTVTVGGINNDQIAFSNPTGSGAGVATYATRDVGNNIVISLTNPVTFTAKDTNNVQIFGYGLTFTDNLKGNITPLGVTLSGTRVYDGLTDASGTILTVSGEIGGDPTLTVTGSGTLASKNASTTATDISAFGTLALSGTGSGNYKIVSGTVLVTPLGVTLSGTRSYDGLTDASGTILTVSGEIGGDPTLTVTGGGTLANKNASTTATDISTLGTLALSGTGSGNYKIVSGTVLVTPLGVTVSGTRGYDGMTDASGAILTVSGEIGGDPMLTVTGKGTLAGKNASTTATDISTLGTLALAGTGSGNYKIVSGTVLVTPLALTITAGDQTKTYGQTATLGTTDYTVGAGLVSGETITSVTLTSTGAPAAANVGAYNISGAGATGSGGFLASNYAITYAPGTLTVNPAVLTVTPVAVSRPYDGTTLNNTTYSDNTGNYTITGFVNGQSLTSAGIALTGSMAFDGSTTTVVKNAATYSQGAGTLGLTSNHGNYTLLFSNPTPNNYVITPMTVTLADLQGTRVYDGMTDADSSILAITNLVSGDQVTISGSGILASKNVGKEQITNLGTLALGGADAGNYRLAASNPNDFVIVTKATLTVTAVTQTKVYDGTAASTMTPTVAGLQTGDSVTGILEQAYGSRNVLGTNGSTLSATQDIGVSDGNNGGNYNIVYKTAMGTITPELLTVTATANTKTFDGTTTATATPTVTSGTIFSPDTGDFTESYNTPHAGTGLTLTPTGSVSDGNGGNNYVITFVPISGAHPDPHGHSGVITPEALVISAVTQTRVYDGATDSSGTPILTSGKLFDGDTLTGLSQSYESRNVLGTNKSTLSVNAGYVLTDASDYAVTLKTAMGTITPELLTVTATANTKTFDGTTTATATPTVTSGTIFSPDTGDFTESYNTPHAGTGLTLTPTGSVSDGNGGNNYIITFVPISGAHPDPHGHSGVITPEALVISAVTQTKVYDGTTASTGTPVITAGMLFDGDTLTGLSQSYGSRNVLGTNKSTLSVNAGYVLTDASDYAVTLKTAMGTITPELLTVTATANTKTFDGTTTATATPTVTSGTIFSPDTGDFTESYNTPHAGTGLTLTPTGSVSDGNGGNNYIITFVPISGAHPDPHGHSGVITPEALVISAVTQTKVYDGTTASTGTPVITAGMLFDGDTLTGLSQSYGSRNVLGTNKSTLSVNAGYVLTDASDYAVTLKTAMGTITPELLTVTATANTKTFDGTTTATATPTVTSGTIFSPDTGDFTESYNTPHAGTGLTLTPTGSVSDGNGGNNYIITFVPLSGAHPDPHGQSGIITPEALVISAVTQTRVYDGATDSSGTPILTSGKLFDGDTLTGLSQSYESRNVLGTDLSTLAINPGYKLTDASDYKVTLLTSMGTITPELLTVTATANTKTFDGTTTATATPTVTSGTIFSPDTGDFTESYNTPHAGTGLTLTPTGSVSDGNGGNNYVITFVPLSGAHPDPHGQSGIITPETLIISAVTQTKVYDGTTASTGTPVLTSGKLFDGDTLTGLSQAYNSKDVLGVDGSTLTINAGYKLTDASDYKVTLVTSMGTITPFSVIVTGTRVYDGATDGDSGILSVTNAVAGDTVTVASGTSTIASRNVGNETITDFGTLTLGGAAAADYTLVGAKGNVIVTPEMLTVMAVPGTKTYDGTTTSTGTPIVTSGTVFGPDTGNFTQTYGSPHAGTGLTLTPSGTVNDGNGGNNYVITYVPVTTGVIDPRPVDMIGTRPFDNQTDANSSILSITNLVPGDTVTVGGVGTLISPDVGPEAIVNFTGLSLGGTSASDYTLIGAIGTVTITPEASPTIIIPNTQTASGNVGTAGGLITLTPRQNGVVTGTIATIDGTDYQPDSQLGCTLGTNGCIQNGVAPTTSHVPPQ